MALRFIDSHDHYYADNGNLPLKYSEVVGGAFGTVTGRNGTHGAGSSVRMNLFTEPQQTWIQGKAFKIANGSVLFSLQDSLDWRASLSVTNDGNLKLQCQGHADRLTTALGLDTTLGYVGYFIEWKIKLSATDGTYEVRVNNVNVLSGTGVTSNTENATIVTTIGSGYECGGDDYYVCDGTGSVNNTFLGECRSIAVVPESAGSDTDWTPSTGANFECVNDVTYTQSNISTKARNETNTDMAIDTYTFQDVTVTGTVKGVQLSLLCRKTDADFRKIRHVLDIDGTKYYGDWQELGDTWKYHKWVWEQDPSLPGAWTRAKINDHCKFGVQYSNVV